MPLVKRLYVGTYSSGNSRGIYPLSYKRDAGEWLLCEPIREIENASYASFNTRHGLHYLLNEQDAGSIAAYKCTEAGEWRQLSTVPTGGDAPCFVSINPANSALAVANYKSGEIAIYRLCEETGLPTGPAVIQRNHGSGPNKDRQDGPHAHCVLFWAHHLYNTDLGTDEILARSYDAGAHVVGEPFIAFQLPPGQGPRHIVFHPFLRLAYVLTELCSEIFVLAANADGTLHEVQRLSNLPAGYGGDSLGGHIALNAASTRLYASNRGHDSIAVYGVAADGRLSRIQIAPTSGKSPRLFAILDDIAKIVVAHEKGDSVVALDLDSDGTILAASASLAVPQPAFIGLA